MEGETDSTVLWSERRQRCDGGEYPPTLRGVKGCGEAECSGRDGAGDSGCKGSRETPVPHAQKEQDRLAGDDPADRPAAVCPDGSTVKVYAGGAKRSDLSERYDLIPAEGLRRAALAMAHGAERFGEKNWTKGMPIGEVLNHALAHIYNYLDGDSSEDHLGHAVANLCMACHFDREEHRVS